MKRSIFRPALLAVLLCVPAMMAAIADAQAVPATVRDAIWRRYPNAQIAVLNEHRVHGAIAYDLRVTTDKGIVSAEALDNGDLVYLGYSAITLASLPPEVSSAVANMFPAQPTDVQKAERTSYRIDVNFGGRGSGYEIRMTALGVVQDIRPMRQVHHTDLPTLPRATRQEWDSLMPRLQQYFTNPRVKSVHRDPEVNGYYWVNLSSANDADVWVHLNAQRDVAEYRVLMNPAALPQPVNLAFGHMFKNAAIRQAYRTEIVEYELLIPNPGERDLFVTMSPTGDVIRIGPAEGPRVKR